MRGKVQNLSKRIRTNRITPAYAGKRFRGQRGSKIYKDHPRLCGEKKERPPFSGCRLGSPPPMRGKVDGVCQYPADSGITPAYAGKSCSLWSVMLSSPDHPRLCGEKFHLPNGSRCRGRITPAYAGKSGFGLFPNLGI